MGKSSEMFIKDREENAEDFDWIEVAEKDYYSKNAPIQYVGHPLLDIIKEHKTQLNDEVKHIAFMPGSRKGEISKLMPVFKKCNKNWV